VTDATFPATDTERLLCGLLCDLVVANPGLTVMQVIDLLCIAVGRERSSKLLRGWERERLADASAELFPGREAVRLPINDMLSLLVARRAIHCTDRQSPVVPGAVLSPTGRTREARDDYPPIDSEFVRLVTVAGRILRNIQDGEISGNLAE
jgi:hypothetical protein